MSTNPNPFNLPSALLLDEPAGTLARTIPRANLNAATVALAGSGLPNVRIIPLPAGLKVSNIGWSSGSTAEVTGSHFWVGLMDKNSNVLAVSADQTGASYVTAATYLVNSVTAPFVVPVTDFYYMVISVSAVTMPTSAAGPAQVGGQTSVPPVFAGSLAAQAAPPAVGANLGAITAGGFNAGFWLS